MAIKIENNNWETQREWPAIEGNGPHLDFAVSSILFLFLQKCHFSNSNHLNAKTNYLITKIDY